VELSGEDLSRYSNNVETVDFYYRCLILRK